MHRKSLTLLIILGSTLLSSPRVFGGDDQVIDVAKVPAAVKQALETVAPGSTWTRAKRDAGDSKTEYELSGTTARGAAIEVDLDVDLMGAAKVVKTEIRPGSSPASAVVAPAPPMTKSRPWLWPLGFAGLALVGFIAQAIFEDVFQAIGRSIARGLGIDRMGKSLEKRLQGKRSGKKTFSESDQTQPELDTGKP